MTVGVLAITIKEFGVAELPSVSVTTSKAL